MHASQDLPIVERVIGLKLGKIFETDLQSLENIKKFFSQLDEILIIGGDKVGEFSVDQVEVSAQITGEGKICLLGSGTKISVNGGLTFILRRRD